MNTEYNLTAGRLLLYGQLAVAAVAVAVGISATLPTLPGAQFLTVVAGPIVFSTIAFPLAALVWCLRRHPAPDVIFSSLLNSVVLSMLSLFALVPLVL